MIAKSTRASLYKRVSYHAVETFVLGVNFISDSMGQLQQPKASKPNDFEKGSIVSRIGFARSG